MEKRKKREKKKNERQTIRLEIKEREESEMHGVIVVTDFTWNEQENRSQHTNILVESFNNNHSQGLLASVSEPANSVPTTHSPKRWDNHTLASSQGVFLRVERGKKE